ncbi:hypothetical protein QUF55_04095 [Clostridiaceae bacterium HSG29]|nr:hypothetical protein [Clostridiaceae bacterium HSG29]
MLVIFGVVIAAISIGGYIALNVSDDSYDSEEIINEFEFIKKNIFRYLKENDVIPENLENMDGFDISKIKYPFKIDKGGKFLILKISDEEEVKKILNKMNKSSYYENPNLFLGIYGVKTRKNIPIPEIIVSPENIDTGVLVNYSYNEISGKDYDIDEVTWEGDIKIYSNPGEYKVSLKIKNTKGIWSEKVEKVIYVGEKKGIKEIVGSKEILLVVYKNGKVSYKAFGANKFGLLDKNKFEDYNVITNADSISMKYDHMLVKTKELNIKSAGSNKFGQLAKNSRIDNVDFSEIWGLKDVIKVETGKYYSGALTKNKKMFLWGLNDSRQINFKRTLFYDMPQNFTQINDIEGFSLGKNHCLIKDNANKLYSFGCNEFGQLGNGFAERVSEIQNVFNFEIDFFHAGDEFSFAVEKEGNLYGWGKNNRYQLGMFGARVKKPVIINSIKNIISIVSSETIVAAITEDGKIFTWGTYFNKFGINVDVIEPIEIPFDEQVKSMAISNNEIYVLTIDDELYVSGYDFLFKKVDITIGLSK